MKLPTSQRHRNLEPDSAEFLSVLAKACRSQQLLEIGGSSGLATIALAAAARANDGRVVSIEIEADRQAEARQTLASLGRADHVEFVLEDAATALARHPALEFVLIDCEKEDYVRFFDQLHLVEHGAIVVADDILSHALDRFVACADGRTSSPSRCLSERASRSRAFDDRPAVDAQQGEPMTRESKKGASRIALANLRYPASPEESVALAGEAIAAAADAGAVLVAFPECYVPGYRVPGRPSPAPDAAFLENAWATLRRACARAGVVGVVGTERFVEGRLRLTVLVIDADGAVAGFQDKVQLDPSEESAYAPGTGRRLFRAGPIAFGIAICHEGFRYPETVRWAARRGAQLVLHPHYSWREPGAFVPSTYGDPRNSFHEKAVLCRAAENTCYVATINAAGVGSPTTSAVARPDGTLLAYQPYGEHGLLVVDLELGEATGFLARRWRVEETAP